MDGLSAVPDNRPIGVFDSGVGGLSVVREIRGLLPHEDIVYFADQANCPYGTKPAEAIKRLATAAAQRLIGESAKLIVVACNTASTAALATLRATFSVPFVGMVPAVKPASATTRTGRVAVLATQATVSAAIFDELVAQFAQNVDVLRQPCPGFVDAVECGDLETPATEALVRRYVEPLVAAGADRLVLGCTHFAFLRPAIARAAPPPIEIVDASLPVARQVERVLAARDLLADRSEPGWLTLLTSGEPGVFLDLATRLLRGPDAGAPEAASGR